MAAPLRAHANNTEYVPMALLLMWALASPIGGSIWLVHGVGRAVDDRPVFPRHRIVAFDGHVDPAAPGYRSHLDRLYRGDRRLVLVRFLRATDRAVMVTKSFDPQDVLEKLIRAARAAGADAADALLGRERVLERLLSSGQARRRRARRVLRSGLARFRGRARRVRIVDGSDAARRGRIAGTRRRHGAAGAGRQIRRPRAGGSSRQNLSRSRHRRPQRAERRSSGRTRARRRRRGDGRATASPIPKAAAQASAARRLRSRPATASSAAMPRPATASASRSSPAKARAWRPITTAPARVMRSISNPPKPSAAAPANARSRVSIRTR